VVVSDCARDTSEMDDRRRRGDRRPPAPAQLMSVPVAAFRSRRRGCGLSTTPYNGRESCRGVGGSYTSDDRCVGGSGA